MIVVMKRGASEQEIQGVVARIEEHGFRSNLSRGEERTIIGVIGDDRRAADAGLFEGLPGVSECVRVLKPFKLASLDFHPDPTIVSIGAGKLAVKVGLGAPLAVMAGPCAVESWEQLERGGAARAKAAGARLLRGGAFKPRSSPYSFQGLGEEGLELLARAREVTGLPVVTEVMTPERGRRSSREYADCLQIGARNMQNYDLLRRPADGARSRCS